jgi:hypothetical protein
MTNLLRRRNNPWHWSCAVLVAIVSVIIAVVVGAEPNSNNEKGSEEPYSLFRPELHLTARIKQHRQGATGDLVEGEEALRKIILNWDPIVNAKAYEICHQCAASINSHTGERQQEEDEDVDSLDGTVISVPVGRDGECGGLPCLVVPGTPLGWNTFHLRVQFMVSDDKKTTTTTTTEEEKEDGWSLWSRVRNFHVHPERLGTVDHSDEL